MNVELVAQMFKNYQANVRFHLEGWFGLIENIDIIVDIPSNAISK